MSRESGQATVELVALLPLLLMAGIAAAAFLAAQAAGEHAGSAAEAGAIALLQGTDPRAAAREALPDSVRGGTTITLHGRRVTVRVRPNLPLEPVARRLEAEATADAGPEPSP
jgi:Flp pilus assembly protein TadG